MRAREEAAGPSFSVIVATAGRKTLARTLRRLAAELAADDEVLVVGDGPQPNARRLFERFARPSWRYLEHGPTRRWGHAQRQFALSRAQRDYVCFIDDDDVHRRGAFAAFRRVAREHPGRPLLFRMDFYGRTLWAEPRLEPRNVGTPMIVAPNVPGKLGSWGESYDADYGFIRETLELQGGAVWCDEVVVSCRPMRLRRLRARAGAARARARSALRQVASRRAAPPGGRHGV